MNTSKKNENDYLEMLADLDVEDGPIEIELECCDAGFVNDMHKGNARSLWQIDFVFYRANNVPAKKIERRMINIRKKWCRRHKDLSDHFPVECSIIW